MLAEIGALVRAHPFNFPDRIAIHWTPGASPDAALLCPPPPSCSIDICRGRPRRLPFLSIFNSTPPIVFLFGALFPPCLALSAFPAAPRYLNFYPFCFGSVLYASTAISGPQLLRPNLRLLSRPVPVRQTHSLFIPIPIPAQTTLLLFIFDDSSALARTTALASLDFHPIARMTRIWNRSDCPACSVGAGLDGSIASRPRAPAVSEPCRRHQADMAHQHHFTSDPIRKATNSASVSSHIRRPRSMRAGRQARRPHETTRAVEPREIPTIGPVAMLDARDAQVGGTR